MPPHETGGRTASESWLFKWGREAEGVVKEYIASLAPNMC